jgi:hypothetical protein
VALIALRVIAIPYLTSRLNAQCPLSTQSGHRRCIVLTGVPVGHAKRAEEEQGGRQQDE